MKERYDLLQNTEPLEEGSAVWLFNPRKKKGLTPKFNWPWEGLYIVVKRINDLVYRIQLGHRTKPKVVHHNRLWLYTGKEGPSWLKGDNSGSQQPELTAETEETIPSRDSEVDGESDEPGESTEGTEPGAAPVDAGLDITISHRYPQRKRVPPTFYGVDS